MVTLSLLSIALIISNDLFTGLNIYRQWQEMINTILRNTKYLCHIFIVRFSSKWALMENTVER